MKCDWGDSQGVYKAGMYTGRGMTAEQAGHMWGVYCMSILQLAHSWLVARRSGVGLHVTVHRHLFWACPKGTTRERALRMRKLEDFNSLVCWFSFKADSQGQVSSFVSTE